ncbi:hypothetical protein SpCBS45565_g06827 [Spizellomyces sp. 'palustris']|nr:hypothetical protein SpCBS45565_g06827 [Spizellomyces sp. 'palustris']
MSDIDHVICVSHTSKENTVLRASLDPLQVSVIPNAVVAADFRPNPSAREAGKIIASRLVYRKGVDLMVAVIPCICAQFKDVNFLIAGDGPKRTDLEQMQDKHGLQDRVKLLGAVDHARVRDVLVRGHIFLNTSLTEAFCIAIVEAACCGLLVVSTRVGGVPEVLPEDMVLFAEPDEKGGCHLESTLGRYEQPSQPDRCNVLDQDLVSSLSRAIETIRTDAPNPLRFHQRVKDMYSWSDVAERTEMVYDTIMTDPHLSLVERLQRYHECGVYAGILACMIVALDYLIWLFLEWLLPREDIDVSPAFNHDVFLEICQKKITTRNDNEIKQGTHEPKGASI